MKNERIEKKIEINNLLIEDEKKTIASKIENEKKYMTVLLNENNLGQLKHYIDSLFEVTEYHQSKIVELEKENKILKWAMNQ